MDSKQVKQALIERHLEAALSLTETERSSKATKLVKPRTVKSHVDKALKFCQVSDLSIEEPIRTIHHFSCTGGTLIIKCVASMANTLVLNEIDLFSRLPTQSGQSQFAPTDMVSLLRQGDANISPHLLADIFVADLATIRNAQWKIGRALVLRDHSHSHFLTGGSVLQEPTLLELIKARLPVKSLVTVRNPVDSYLSMMKQDWHTHFSPSSFAEYCRRYLCFLKKYQGVSIIKYEDFVANPKTVMQKICEYLSLDYFAGFEDVFDSFSFSGDSGRSGAVISMRERHELPAAETLGLDADAVQKVYAKLCKALDYTHLYEM